MWWCSNNDAIAAIYSSQLTLFILLSLNMDPLPVTLRLYPLSPSDTIYGILFENYTQAIHKMKPVYRLLVSTILVSPPRKQKYIHKKIQYRTVIFVCHIFLATYPIYLTLPENRPSPCFPSLIPRISFRHNIWYFIWKLYPSYT